MSDAYREKGPLFERYVKVALKWAMPTATLYRGAQSNEGGAGQADVEAPILHVECKWRRKADLRAAMAQAMDDADPARLRVVVALDDPDKSGEAQAMAMLPFEDLLCLLHSLWGLLGPERGRRWTKLDHAPPSPAQFWSEVAGRRGRTTANQDSDEEE